MKKDSSISPLNNNSLLKIPSMIRMYTTPGAGQGSELEINKWLQTGGLGLIDQEDQDHDNDCLQPVGNADKPVHIAVFPAGRPPVEQVSEYHNTKDKLVG